MLVHIVLAAGCGLLPTAGPAPEDGHGHDGHGHDDHATVEHRFDDPERWSAVFDDPARDDWQKPAELVAALQVQPGQTVADIGAGTGYFNPHFAAAVGRQGKVIAVDVEPSLVEHMRARATSDRTPQVEARHTLPDRSGLRPAEADHVVLIDTYHHISDRVAYFSALKGTVKPGGQLVVVDFDPSADTDHGPPPEHRISLDKVTEELAEAGWERVGALDLLPYQYVGRFEPQQPSPTR